MADDDPQPVQIEFLTFEDVCAIHDRGLLEFGEGAPGFIDENVVRSAAGQAQASIRNQYMHAFPAGMAAENEVRSHALVAGGKVGELSKARTPTHGTRGCGDRTAARSDAADAVEVCD